MVLGLLLAALPLAFNACSDGGFKSNVSDEASREATGPEGNQTRRSGGPAIVATGHWKSSLYSCDGGRSWQGYQSQDNDFRCWQASHGNVDCDHSSSSATGLTWGPKGFMATYGWGTPGQVELSDDAINWTVVHQGRTWAGVAFGNQTYVLNERSPLLSTDGNTWEPGGALNFVPWNARRIFFVPQQGGVFISVAQSGATHDLMISTDNGQTFVRPTLPMGCGNGQLAYGGDRIVLLSESLCVSSDAGQTWQIHPNKPTGFMIFDGQEFKVYSAGQVARSVDGMTWSLTPLQLNGAAATRLSFAQVAFEPESGSYAGIYQQWGNFYEQTQFYHSRDGVNWLQLNKSSGEAPVAPHPIRHIAVGHSMACGE